MKTYIEVLKSYAVFGGRSRRREYWHFVVVNVVITIVLTMIDITAGTHYTFLIAYYVAVLLPGLGVSIRRLHDTNRSAWWVLINLYPAVGWLFFLFCMALDSDAGENRYGPSPKAIPTST